MASSIYQQTMQAWPSLVDIGKRIFISGLELELFYFEAGYKEKDPLILIHGLGDEADTWRHIIHPLSDQFHVLALDLPGFGRSERPEVDYTPEFMLNALNGFMNQLDIGRAWLIGSSLGGILAHKLALAQPERVKGLILVGGALLQAARMPDLGIRLMQLPGFGEWLYTRLRKDPQAAYKSLNNVYYQLESLPGADRSFLFTRVNQRVWSDGQRRAYFSTLRQLARWLKGIQKELPDQLSQLQIPTLVFRGEHDSIFPDVNADALIALQPNATKAVIMNTGHLPQQEDPVEFIRIVNMWLIETATNQSV